MYLEDLITCVHIIQLKILTAMRVGQKQKKIDINIPKLDDFIHKVYINVARKIYKNVYLFEIDVMPLQIQKHNRELEILIQEGILNTIRESIPVEAILKQYMEQTIEEDVVEEIKEQIVEDTSTPEQIAPIAPPAPLVQSNSQISFDNMDYIKDYDNNVISVDAPKTIDRLEEISELRTKQRKIDEAEEDEGDKIKIHDDFINLDDMDIHVIDEPKLKLLPDLLIDDIEVLE
jgi:hypothetical protein